MGLWPWYVLVAIALMVELWLIQSGRDSLSMRIWKAVRYWNFFMYLIGFITGVLAAHFFWIPAGCDPTQGW